MYMQPAISGNDSLANSSNSVQLLRKFQIMRSKVADLQTCSLEFSRILVNINFTAGLHSLPVARPRSETAEQAVGHQPEGQLHV